MLSNFPLVILSLLSSSILLKAENLFWLGEPSCLKSSPAGNGLTRVTFIRQDSAGVRSLCLSWWSEDKQLVTCEVNTNSLVTERYHALCNRSGIQGEEIPQMFNISRLLAPDAPCALVSSSAPETTGKTRRKRAWIFPGTLWCGAGNKAVRYEQLGMFKSTDRCCREHDHCPHTIPAYMTNYGVFNSKFFTLSHCDCDQSFRHCLRGTNKSISNTVAYSFFNILRVPCFELKQQRQCTETYSWGMCRVAKETLYAVFKSPLPYNATYVTHQYGNNTDGKRLTSGQDQPVTESNTVNSHMSPTPPTEHSFKDPPTGDTTVSYSISTPYITTPYYNNTTYRTQKQPFMSQLTTNTAVTKNYQEVATSLGGNTFQPQSKSSLEPNETFHIATTPSSSTNGLSVNVTERELVSNIMELEDSWSTATTATPATTNLIRKKNHSKGFLWNIGQDANDTHSLKDLKLNIALKNITVKWILCSSLKYLDDCRYKIRPLGKKYHLWNMDSKTSYHCNCTNRMALELESLMQPSFVPMLLMDFISQYCFNLPKEKECKSKKSCSRGFNKASDLIQALKKTEEKWTAPIQKSGNVRKRGIPVRLYKRCLRLEREADMMVPLT